MSPHRTRLEGSGGDALIRMRRGECLGVQWGDIDLERHSVTIRRQVRLVGKRIDVTPRTKTGKGRNINLDTTTVAELRAHKVWQAQELLKLGIRLSDTTFVFCHPDARPYQPERFSREFARS